MKERDKEINKGLKSLVKSSVIVLMAFILSKIFGYLYRIIIARYFGPEGYGLFSLSIVIVGWFVAISSLGFVEGMVRYISFYRGKNELDKIKYIYRFSSRILFVSTLITALILFFTSNFISVSIFHNPDLSFYVKIFSIMLPFWVFSTYFLSIMRAFEKVKEVSFIESILQSFSKLLFLVFFIFLGFKTNAIIFSFFLGILIMFLLAYFYCKIKLPKIFLNYKLDAETKRETSKNFFSYSWPVLFFGIISSIFYWVDSLSIGFFKSATEVGLYNAVIPIALLFNIAPEIFLQLFFPMITRKYSLNDLDFIKETSKQIGKWVFMINLPLFILMIFFPGMIINILFGQKYLIAANSLRFLVFGALFASVFIISNNLISMIGKSKIIFYDIIIATLINIILNIILIPQPVIFGMDNSLGINGASIATTISIIIFNTLFLIQARHYTTIVPTKLDNFKIFFAALISFVLLILLKNITVITIFSFILLTIFFLLSYILLLFLFKAFDEKDIMIFETFKRKIKSYKS